MTHISNHPRIEMVPRLSLVPNPDNPRKHNEKQLRQISSSLDRFGFLVPIVVDDASLIVAGAGRWAAAGLIGMTDVPVIRAKFITEADRRAFALAENRLGDLSDWDDAKLRVELAYLYEQDYDLNLAGFSVGDLDFEIETDAKAAEVPVELPDPNAVAVSCVGDLWKIGPHHLYCGSSQQAESFELLLGGDRATMVFSDPPYNVKIGGNVSGLGKVKHREFVEASGEMSPGEFTTFLRAVFRHCVRFTVGGSIHYQCMDWRHVREMLDAADGVYTTFKQLVVWNKCSGSMGAFYRSQHELIFVFKSGTDPHINTFGLGEKGRYRTNVCLLRQRDPGIQYHHQHGEIDPQRPPVLCSIRARGHWRAHPRQDRGVQEEGHVDGRAGAARLRRSRAQAHRQRARGRDGPADLRTSSSRWYHSGAGCRSCGARRDVVTAIVHGRHPVDLTTRMLLRAADMPLAWADQRKVLGFN